MLHSMTEQTIEAERFVLPPISTLDEYIPSKNKKPTNTNYNLLSPPTSFTPSSTSPTSLSSGHSLVLTTQHPPSPPRAGFEKMDTPIYPLQDTTLRTISSDVNQVIQHSHSLCDNMVHYKPYILSSATSSNHHDELRPWMDDMIGKANQVLNALLRLRKHQMVSDMSPPPHSKTTARRYSDQQSFTFTHPYQRSSSIPSSSSANASSRITITKRDWPNTPAARHQYLHHQDHSNTSIPSRQRKRGKRASFQGRCHSCNISETPEWRRGPDGARTLCNACGLHYAKLARKKAASLSTSG